MSHALNRTFALALAAVVLAGPGRAQDDATTGANAELTDRQKVEQCMRAVTNAGSDPRACVGVVADPCLDALGEGDKSQAAACMDRETAIWAENLESSVKELSRVLGRQAPEALQEVQEAWLVYRDRRCGFGSTLYSDEEFVGIWRATCLLEETGRRAVEVGTILKEARSRGG
ncbi:lysozyme inhibitor LprI family protein [Lutibaculum baratangense]|uniref:Lysozyme inhibitor LprI-like N-terminal domain-containing protein n=1 Tax=Lutibaculum baratangense AMV1 TaxID=631454 RepID=V4R3N7_9HYPH|nr:lysozyme inhibitor LprI family protein [Lutibaculum baratangense]ESR26562.1 protein of unknown function DUF1311 [Lutibaculum baratangense AMV1]